MPKFLGIKRRGVLIHALEDRPDLFIRHLWEKPHDKVVFEYTLAVQLHQILEREPRPAWAFLLQLEFPREKRERGPDTLLPINKEVLLISVSVRYLLHVELRYQYSNNMVSIRELF